MSDQEILNKIKNLPEEYKTQVLNFAEFLGQKETITKKKPMKAGFLKGAIVIHDEETFNEPLEDFKEYM